MERMKRITVLGSTGSIGTQTLDVARWRGYEVVGLAAGSNADLLLEQAEAFRPARVSCSEDVADRLVDRLPRGVELLAGPGAADEVARAESDVVVAAIPGIAGLAPTRAALEAGRDVALANKEAMVVAGPLVRALAAERSARITPVDSEHAALYQCLANEPRDAVASLVLTASGGPFRTAPADLREVTPEQALDHPTWSMGAKVTIDSSTLFNKGLEVLEAHFLFDWPLDRIEVVIHPQSLVHGLVRFCDGNLLAQIGPHDMRIPIQVGIEASARPPVPLEPLPLEGVWEFHRPDHERFPSLQLAYRAGALGGTAPTALNAADEVAVAAFLAGRLPYLGIPRLLARVLDDLEASQARSETLSWNAIDDTDRWAREHAERLVPELAAEAGA